MTPNDRTAEIEDAEEFYCRSLAAYSRAKEAAEALGAVRADMDAHTFNERSKRITALERSLNGALDALGHLHGLRILASLDECMDAEALVRATYAAASEIRRSQLDGGTLSYGRERHDAPFTRTLCATVVGGTLSPLDAFDGLERRIESLQPKLAPSPTR